MDEPSAALALLVECQLNEIIKNMMSTKLLYSFRTRLSITKHMDWIYHLKNGKVSEQK